MEDHKVGSVGFPLTRIENQDEYEVLLEIPDEDDDTICNAKINAKIKFFWSYYKHYEDLYNNADKKQKSLQSLLDKSFQLLDNLNGKELALKVEPFIKMEEDKIDELKRQKVVQPKPEETIKVTKVSPQQPDIEQQIADNLEQIIQNKLSKELL
jgi:hypothetical protein